MRNKEININEIEKKIGYTFKDKSLLVQAFTRTSFCNENVPSANLKYQSNEVLEFFGDGVLSVAIISFLLKECTERYTYGIKTDWDEGDFSNIKSKLSDKQNLSKSMKALGLQKHLRMGEGDAKLGIENEPSVMEDLFESIVGAIYIDSAMNMDAVIKSVSNMLDMSVYTDRQKPIQSAKNALQEWCADKKRRLPAPRYETLSEVGPDHKKTYMRGCYIGDRLVGRGIGKNFKIADAEAAEDALKALTAEFGTDKQTKVVKNNVVLPKKHAEEKTPSSKQAAGSGNPTVPTVNKVTKKSASPIESLRAYAASNKKPSPAFKDLGTVKHSGNLICRVECVFLNETVIGEGNTRTEARSNAAKIMADKIIATGKKAVKQSPQSAKSKPTLNTRKTPPSVKRPTGTAKSAAPSKATKNAKKRKSGQTKKTAPSKSI